MSENCTHDCSTCSQNCEHREIPKEKLNSFSKVKRVYAVVSGKGGVGKSLVSSLLAVESSRQGYKTAILDADVTGPSIPKVFGAQQRAEANDSGIFPVESKLGTKIMSINLLLENPADPVVWRGPVIAGAVKQFWSDVIWGDVDNMFIDCPPGTGDVPLTIFQSLPIDGIIIVTSPQDLVSMIVEKAVKMAQLMNVSIVGIVENMAYFVCDKCNEKHYVFGKGNVKQIAAVNQIENYCQIPFDKTIANLCDRGLIELHEATYLEEFFKNIIK
ncbi:MAG: Mrp/NBP35 family ATP-binding protein [Clostridia bacterium]|nr:Mrp/NBP35 family ATP-binding protein [Clostridia bacterium]